MVHEVLDIASAHVHSFPSLPQPYETFTTVSPKQRKQKATQTEFMKSQERDEFWQQKIISLEVSSSMQAAS